jgi:hypothetical protein
MSQQHDDIEGLSYQMLVQFRELFKQSPAEAILRYGIGFNEGTRIASLSHDQMKKLARSGKLVFSVRLPDLASL